MRLGRAKLSCHVGCIKRARHEQRPRRALADQRLEFWAVGLGRSLYFIEIFSVSTISHLRSTQPVRNSHSVRIWPARYRWLRARGDEPVLMSRTIVACAPFTFFSTTVISFGSSRLKPQLIGAEFTFSEGTSRTQVSWIRSRITSSVSSGTLSDCDPDDVCFPSPEGGPQPRELVNSSANPMSAERTNAALGSFRS